MLAEVMNQSRLPAAESRPRDPTLALERQEGSRLAGPRYQKQDGGIEDQAEKREGLT